VRVSVKLTSRYLQEGTVNFGNYKLDIVDHKKMVFRMK
jgi:hypothetical protein